MSGRSWRGRGGRGVGGFMGRLLSTRLEEYGKTGDLDDLEGAVAYLCHTYPEYRRQKQGAFSKQVAKVAASLMEELRLQKIEDRHLSNKDKNCDDSASNSNSEWSERGGASTGGDVGSSDAEFNSDAAMDEDQNERLNSSLRTLYGISSSKRAAECSSPRQAADGEPAKIVRSQKTELSGEQNRGRSQSRHPKKLTVEPSGTATSGDATKRSKSQKSRKRDTDSGAAAAKPDKKKLKKMVPARKHATISKTAMTVPKPVRYSDLGGIEDVLQDIKELIEYPLGHPEVYTWLGVEPPRGMLLHGPPGCGKTALANAIANECGVPFFRVSAPEIVSGMSGESEAKIRNLFRDAAGAAPSIIFIDEIDSIAQKRENAQREMERRIVAQLLTCMDDLSGMQAAIETPNLVGDADGPGQATNPVEPDTQAPAQGDASDKGVPPESGPPPTGGHVIVLGATNRPDALDPALRRAGRFDREISLGIPNEAARMRILGVMCKKLKLEGNFDFGVVARKTPGFVGADLEALAKEAAAVAITRIFANLESKKATEATRTGNICGGVDRKPDDMMVDGEVSIKKELEPFTEEELSSLAITMADFEAAIPKVQPSVRREGFTTTPDVTWADVGSLEDVREELSFAITQPILNPERFESLGMSFACGVLLFGPPGCGKTLVAKAVANDAGANFMSIKGPELLNKYVGESERAVRQLFTRARAAKPCVLFFDEMDALAPRRGSDNQAAERVVNQLLTEMDGIDSREGVYLVAATNRPDIIDPALLRPGRLDKMLYVPLPDPPGRVSVLEALLKKTPLAEDVNAKEIGLDQRCTGFSGADLAALVREACIMALKESIRTGKQGATVVGREHFEAALATVKPSVSKEDQRLYARMHATLRRSRAHIQPKVSDKEG